MVRFATGPKATWYVADGTWKRTTLMTDRELRRPMPRLSGPAADGDVGRRLPRGGHVLLTAKVAQYTDNAQRRLRAKNPARA
jgi:hypothetical protein